MSQQQLGQGPGNLVPNSEKVDFLAGEDISEGEVVCLETAKGAGSYEILLVDTDAAATSIVVGVAAEDIAEGAWGEVYVSGYCPKVRTDAGVAVGEPLVPHDTVAGECDTMAAGQEHLVFAWSLAADDGDYVDAWIIKRF